MKRTSIHNISSSGPL